LNGIQIGSKTLTVRRAQPKSGMAPTAASMPGMINPLMMAGLMPQMPGLAGLGLPGLGGLAGLVGLGAGETRK